MGAAFDVTVRPAVESDLAAVMTLVGRCIDDMRGRGIEQWDDVYPAHDRFADDVAAGTLYVATSGGDLVGTFTLNDYQDPEYVDVPWSVTDGSVGVVHRLMVDPEVQGRRLARRLMRAAELIAIDQGYTVMRLDAFTLNPRALRLYDALGYRDAGGVQFRKGAFRCFEKRLTAATQSDVRPVTR